jgi:hypothetical protein
MANLGAQAGSGLDASDITTGTLGNTVQDNITRLGTVTTGTMNNTIGSSATFPAGTLIKTTVKQDTTANVDRTATSGMAAKTYTAITCTVGNTIVFSWDFHFYAELTSGSASDRTGYVYCYQNDTSATAGGATSGFGTLLSSYRVGRNLKEGSGSSASSFESIHIQAAFEATATTHYLGLVFNSGGSTVQTQVYASTNYPLLLTAYEFQGDVLT